MIGAILGDIVGSPYEFDKASKVKDFTLFDQRCEFTDDTVYDLHLTFPNVKTNEFF